MKFLINYFKLTKCPIHSSEKIKMLTSLLIFIIFTIIYYYTYLHSLIFIIILFIWNKRRPKSYPPGPPSIPILGSTPFINLRNFQFTLDDLKAKYGPVIGMRFGRSSVVVICGKKEVEEVLRRDEFQGRPNFNKNGKGIMFSDEEFWTHQRRFTVRHLRDFGFGKNTIEHVIIGEIDEFFQKKLENHYIVQVSGLFNISSVNVLWAMMGGKRYSHDDPEFHHLLSGLEKRFRSGTAAGSFVNRFPTLAKLLPFLPSVKNEKITEKLLNGFLEKAFKEHRQTRKEDEPRDLIDVYLNELDSGKDLHESFSELTLRNICMEFFSAGAESVGNSIGFNLLYNVLYPEWQEQLHEEIVSVIGRERRPSLDDQRRLPKLEAFITEVFRCNTIAGLTVPHRCYTETTLNGYNIPENCMILISLSSVLMDRDQWKDPENFRPERHLDNQGFFVKEKDALPIFGAGKRICPGETLARNIIFLFLTSMIQQYQFSIPKGHPKPSTVCLTGFTQAPQPFEVAITRRF